MRKSLYFFVAVILVALMVVESCSTRQNKRFSFAFYNVENLFDTVNNPNTRDDDFLPSSKIAWNTKRYKHKIENLAKVMSSIESGGFPSVFGLCEVENKKVVEDLIHHPLLAKAGYKIIHKDSPDDRGIDVALLYRPEQFKPIDTEFIKVDFPGDFAYDTREILYVKGLTVHGDIVHIFVNHWDSRWRGKEKTEPYRIFTAEKLWNRTQKIFKEDPHANILIGGDLNDNPTDKSLTEGLQAVEPRKPLAEQQLYNLSLIPFKKGKGTVYRKGWNMFDQIIISTALLTGNNGLQVTSPEQRIIKHDWMLYHPRKGEPRPNRTAAARYYGGYSDHLPVYIEMNIDESKDIFTIINCRNPFAWSIPPVR